MAQNNLELKLPLQVFPTILCKTKNTLNWKEKKRTLSLIMPSFQLGQPLAISRIPRPSHLKDNYSEKPWRRTGPLETVAFHIYACIHLLFSWFRVTAH